MRMRSSTQAVWAPPMYTVPLTQLAKNPQPYPQEHINLLAHSLQHVHAQTIPVPNPKTARETIENIVFQELALPSQNILSVMVIERQVIAAQSKAPQALAHLKLIALDASGTHPVEIVGIRHATQERTTKKNKAENQATNPARLPLRKTAQ